MNTTFETFYRQLGRATATVLFLALACFGLSIVSALLGFPQAVVSFNGATISVGYAFLAILSVFLISSVIAAFIRWLDRRSIAAQKS